MAFLTLLRILVYVELIIFDIACISALLLIITGFTIAAYKVFSMICILKDSTFVKCEKVLISVQKVLKYAGWCFLICICRFCIC